jgi:hypothetical protein
LRNRHVAPFSVRNVTSIVPEIELAQVAVQVLAASAERAARGSMYLQGFFRERQQKRPVVSRGHLVQGVVKLPPFAKTKSLRKERDARKMML